MASRNSTTQGLGDLNQPTSFAMWMQPASCQRASALRQAVIGAGSARKHEGPMIPRAGGHALTIAGLSRLASGRDRQNSCADGGFLKATGNTVASLMSTPGRTRQVRAIGPARSPKEIAVGSMSFDHGSSGAAMAQESRQPPAKRRRRTPFPTILSTPSRAVAYRGLSRAGAGVFGIRKSLLLRQSLTRLPRV